MMRARRPQQMNLSRGPMPGGPGGVAALRSRRKLLESGPPLRAAWIALAAMILVLAEAAKNTKNATAPNGVISY